MNPGSTIHWPCDFGKGNLPLSLSFQVYKLGLVIATAIWLLEESCEVFSKLKCQSTRLWLTKIRESLHKLSCIHVGEH